MDKVPLSIWYRTNWLSSNRFDSFPEMLARMDSSRRIRSWLYEHLPANTKEQISSLHIDFFLITFTFDCFFSFQCFVLTRSVVGHPSLYSRKYECDRYILKRTIFDIRDLLCWLVYSTASLGIIQRIFSFSFRWRENCPVLQFFHANGFFSSNNFSISMLISMTDTDMHFIERRSWLDQCTKICCRESTSRGQPFRPDGMADDSCLQMNDRMLKS